MHDQWYNFTLSILAFPKPLEPVNSTPIPPHALPHTHTSTHLCIHRNMVWARLYCTGLPPCLTNRALCVWVWRRQLHSLHMKFTCSPLHQCFLSMHVAAVLSTLETVPTPSDPPACPTPLIFCLGCFCLLSKFLFLSGIKQWVCGQLWLTPNPMKLQGMKGRTYFCPMESHCRFNLEHWKSAQSLQDYTHTGVLILILVV